jgi:hypothetical protein
MFTTASQLLEDFVEHLLASQEIFVNERSESSTSRDKCHMPYEGLEEYLSRRI